MCNRWALDADQAIQLLLQADCNNLLDCGKNAAGIGSATVQEAYTAAAIAAQHPVPHLQASLLGPANQPLLSMASDILMPGGMLSCEDTDMLQTCLVYSCQVQEQQPRGEPTMLNKWDYPRIDRIVNNFWTQHHRVVEMVKTALDQMAFDDDDDDDDVASSICSDEVSKYKLHFICGVNERVDGPVYKDKPSTFMYRCSHVNFLATPSAGGPPTLFFAEFHGTKVGLCCPVKVPPPRTEQVRCFYCECHGSRIVHPASKSFCGSEFEEIVLCGDELYLDWYSNDEIISHSHQVSYWADHVEDDWIYCSYSLEDDKDEGIADFLHNEILYAKFR